MAIRDGATFLVLPVNFMFKRVCAVAAGWRRPAAAIVLLAATAAGAQTPGPAEAQVLEQQGKLDEAAQVWRSVTRRNPTNAAAFANLGVVLSKQGSYQDAVAAYRKALALNPKLQGVYLNLGLAEFKQGHFEAAIAPLSKALTADPKSEQVRTLLGISYYGAQRFAEAVKYLKPVADSDPQNSELHRMLAQSCLWAKQYACAQDEFRKLLLMNPDSAAVHMFSGEALDGMGKTDEAILEFQAAAKVAPREPNVHFGLGYLYWKTHDYDIAHREFEAELQLDPNHLQALAYLGDTEMKQEHWESALGWLQKSLREKNDNRMAALDLGVVLAQLGRNDEALVALKRAVALDPAQPDAHYRLGRLYQQMGRRAESQQEFDKVRDLRQKADEDFVHKMSPASPTSGLPEPQPHN